MELSEIQEWALRRFTFGQHLQSIADYRHLVREIKWQTLRSLRNAGLVEQYEHGYQDWRMRTTDAGIAALDAIDSAEADRKQRSNFAAVADGFAPPYPSEY